MQSTLFDWAELCEMLAATAGLLDKRMQIAAYLENLALEPAEIAVQYLSGKIFPESSPRMLHVGGTLVQHALLLCSGASSTSLSAAYRQSGDLGTAAAEVLAASSPMGLSLPLQEVSAQFEWIAAATTAKMRLARVAQFLRQLSTLEAKYVVKLMLGDLRIGVQQSLVEEALAAATGEDLAAVRRAIMLTGDLQQVLRLARQHDLQTAKMQIFHPLGFMLASPAADADEAIQIFRTREKSSLEKKEFGPETHRTGFQMEDKYDGIRAQIHCGDGGQPGKVRIFSRTGDDITPSFPELRVAFRAISIPAILDGEILAWDAKANRALSFRALQPRLGRKRVPEVLQRSAPVVFMAFDILFCDGALLLDYPLSERRDQLVRFCTKIGALTAYTESNLENDNTQRNLFAAKAIDPEVISFPRLLLAPASIAFGEALSPADIDTAYDATRLRGNEGLMLKARDSHYQPGRRGKAWLKLKRELATLDVVVTAVEYGHGRRAKVLSDYTFAIRDGENLKNVGKAYSGLTDVEIATLTKWFLAHRIADEGRTLQVQPEIVIEVAFNNVMRSTRHDSGFALRFPRIVRLRPEKPAAEIDTLAQVEAVYRSQPEHRRAEAP